MDIDNLVGTVRSVAEVLRDAAPFLASLVHPCFPGNEAGLSSWPPGRGYDAEGYWTSDRHNPEGVRIRVGSVTGRFRPISTFTWTRGLSFNASTSRPALSPSSSLSPSVELCSSEPSPERIW
jgi:hypothetical protein